MSEPISPAELREQGECRFDPELHSGPPRLTIEPAAERMAREDVAREVCASCPLLTTCRENTLRDLPASGIWAGLTAREIRALGTATRELAEVA